MDAIEVKYNQTNEINWFEIILFQIDLLYLLCN